MKITDKEITTRNVVVELDRSETLALHDELNTVYDMVTMHLHDAGDRLEYWHNNFPLLRELSRSL